MKSKYSFFRIAIGFLFVFFFLFFSDSILMNEESEEDFHIICSNDEETVLKTAETPEHSFAYVMGGMKLGSSKLPVRLRASGLLKTFLFFTVLFRLFGKSILFIPKMECFYTYVQVCLFQRARFLRELFILLKEDGKIKTCISLHIA